MSAISNARWILLSQGSRTGIQLSSLVILSRLLNPSEYGLMAMSQVVINFIYLLRDMGTAAAVVQKETLTDDTTNTVFWFNIGLGLFLGTTLFATAPLIADAFQAPRLVEVLWVLALVFPISSTAAVHQALLERGSGFRVVARVEIVSSLVGLVVALGLAWYGAGVFALAFQILATVICSTVQLWLANRWRPRLTWNGAEFRELWRFSGHFTGFTFINYFARNADALIIGRVLGQVALGFYSQAYKVMMFPLQSMTYVASRALFPIMSRQQNDRPQMAQLYFRSVGVIATLTAPMMAGLWLLREPFIAVVLGPQWHSVAPILGWLAPVGFIQSLTSTTGTVMMATGRTNLLMRQGVISTILLVTSFVLGVREGVEGVARYYFFANLFNLVPCFYYPLKELAAGPADLLRAVWKPITFAVVMVAALAPLTALLAGYTSSAPVLLAVPTIVGMALFGLLLLMFSRQSLHDFKKFASGR